MLLSHVCLQNKEMSIAQLFSHLIKKTINQYYTPPGWTELHVEVSLSKILHPKLLLTCRCHHWGPCDKLATYSGCTLPLPRDSWGWLQQQPPRPLEKGMKQLQTIKIMESQYNGKGTLLSLNRPFIQQSKMLLSVNFHKVVKSSRMFFQEM